MKKLISKLTAVVMLSLLPIKPIVYGLGEVKNSDPQAAVEQTIINHTRKFNPRGTL